MPPKLNCPPVDAFRRPPEEISVVIQEKKFQDLLPLLASRTRLGLSMQRMPEGKLKIEVISLGLAVQGEVKKEDIRLIRERLIVALLETGHSPVEDPRLLDAAE